VFAYLAVSHWIEDRGAPIAVVNPQLINLEVYLSLQGPASSPTQGPSIRYEDQRIHVRRRGPVAVPLIQAGTGIQRFRCALI
jgi:hypothetical protein